MLGSLGYIGRRLLQLVPLLFGILLISFLLLRMSPGDPARLLLGPRATETQVAAKRAELGLDENILVQFLQYGRRLLAGDLGESIRSRKPVTSEIWQKSEVTAWILVGTLVIALLVAVPLAVLSVQRPGGAVDVVVRAAGTVGYSLPGYWLGIIFILVFSLNLGLFPVQGFGEGLWGHLHSVVLPCSTLALSIAPVLLRSLRASMLDVLAADHVVTARAAGWNGWSLYRDHVLRNAAPPIVTLLALQVGYLLFGTVLVEQIFRLPGLGQAVVSGVASRDFPMVQGITLAFAVLVVLSQLVADLVHSALDPRVRR